MVTQMYHKEIINLFIIITQTYIKSFRYQDLPGELYNILQSNLPAANGIIHIVNSLRKKTSTDNLRNPQVQKH